MVCLSYALSYPADFASLSWTGLVPEDRDLGNLTADLLAHPSSLNHCGRTSNACEAA